MTTDGRSIVEGCFSYQLQLKIGIRQGQGDTWTLVFANGEVWEIPLAAIEGG